MSIYNRTAKFRRTGKSFFLSIILHTITAISLMITLPTWYRQIQTAQTVTHDKIEISISHHRFHLTRPKEIPKAIQTPSISQRQATSKKVTSKVRERSEFPQRSKKLSSISKIQTHTKLASIDQSPLGVPNDEKKEHDLLSNEIAVLDVEIGKIETEIDVEFRRGMFETELENEEISEISDQKNVSFAERSDQIGDAMRSIAESVADGRNSDPIDIVFLLDASGSMTNDIKTVGQHLKEMAKVFSENGIDFTIGVVKFKYQALIFEQTKDYTKFERLLDNMECGGHERSFNAIVKSAKRVHFRENADRRFILVTDESFDGDRSYTITEVISAVRGAGIVVDVIGIQDRYHKYLAQQTSGLWFPIPKNF